jgi:hypothetical protein
MISKIRLALLCLVCVGVIPSTAAAQKTVPIVASAMTSAGGTVLFTSGSLGSGTFDLRVPANIRTTFVQAGIATGLAAGTYQVGVCGKADSGQGANWNNNEFGFVTALVF